MTPLPATPSERLSRALSSSQHFSGSEPTIGSVIPSISMPMHLSLDSFSCTVTAPGSKKIAFAKTFRAGALDPFTFDGAVEAAALAGHARVSPRLLEADAAHSVLLFEPAPPEFGMALARDAQKPAIKAAILAAKKQWHGQPLLARDLSPFELAKDYVARLEPHLEAGAEQPIPYKGSIPFSGLRDWVGRMGEAFAAAGTDKAPIHGENTVSNILVGPGNTILLVDFDRAVNADPLYDLGALSLDICRDDNERMEMIEMYSGKGSATLLARINLYAVVDDFLWGCWALLAELNPEMRGPELLKYASNRFLRASYHLTAFDTALLLGRI